MQKYNDDGYPAQNRSTLYYRLPLKNKTTIYDYLFQTVNKRRITTTHYRYIDILSDRTNIEGMLIFFE